MRQEANKWVLQQICNNGIKIFITKMARPRKKTFKMFHLPTYALKLDIYKKDVVYSRARFNFVHDTTERTDVKWLKYRLWSIAEHEFSDVRGRRIVDIDMPEETRSEKSVCTITVCFKKKDDDDNYEEYVLSHVANVMDKALELFAEYGFSVVSPGDKYNFI